MTDFEIMIKALRLAWISRLLCTGHQNWKSVPIHFFAQYGGLEFILNCNYDVKYFENLPKFYKEILMYFSDLKTLYNSDSSSKRDTILFNNKQILIGGKPFFNKEWFSKGIRTISDLMDSDGRFISFDTFQSKFGLTRTNFLQFYQVVHAIPKNLAAKALSMKLSLEPREFEFDPSSFALEPGIILNLAKMKSRDFYWLFIKKSYTEEQTGAKRWNEKIPMNKDSWQSVYTSVKSISKEMKLREFNFKFLHRIIVTRKELCRYGIKTDEECLYCGEPDSIDHTYIYCQFTQQFIKNIVQWFNEVNKCNFNLGMKEILFGIRNTREDLVKKLNYTLLFLRNYIYKCKLKEDALLVPDFINKLTRKYKIETNE